MSEARKIRDNNSIPSTVSGGVLWYMVRFGNLNLLGMGGWFGLLWYQKGSVILSRLILMLRSWT